MLFAVVCTDKPASLEVRQAARPRHLEYLTGRAACLVHAGPLLDAAGQPCGSLLLVDVADRAAAEQMSAADPYALAGLFESVVIRPYRAVFRDGALLA